MEKSEEGHSFSFSWRELKNKRALQYAAGIVLFLSFVAGMWFMMDRRRKDRRYPRGQCGCKKCDMCADKEVKEVPGCSITPMKVASPCMENPAVPTTSVAPAVQAPAAIQALCAGSSVAPIRLAKAPCACRNVACKRQQAYARMASGNSNSNNEDEVVEIEIANARMSSDATDSGEAEDSQDVQEAMMASGELEQAADSQDSARHGDGKPRGKHGKQGGKKQ